MDRKTELLIRVYLVFFGFVLFALLIIGKVIKISLLDGEKYRAKGGKNIKLKEVEGLRGDIYSANGNLLSTSIPEFDIYVDLKTPKSKVFNENIDGLSRALGEHFGGAAKEWKTKLMRERGAKNGFYPLMKSVSKDQKDLLRTFPLFSLNPNKGGFISRRKSIREKPYKDLCSRTIGLDRANSSKIGLERTFDNFLKGPTEKRLMQWFPYRNNWLPVFDPEEITQKRGADVVTTLDMTLQGIAYDEVLTAVQKYNAKAGTAIIMEVKTGAIKSIVNLGMQKDSSYREDYNYAVGRKSEPGSTFKLISALAMMKDGIVDLDTEVKLYGGKRKFYDLTMRDSKIHGIQKATFKEAFEMSSNVAFGTVAFNGYKNREGWIKFYETLEEMGVMNNTAIEIFGENKPFFKNPKRDTNSIALRWGGTTVPWMAHGYELEMTPLQVLNFYNAVANNGRMMKPYLASEIVKDGKTVKKLRPQVLKEKIAEQNIINDAQEMLKAVAESGTAKKLKIDNTSFAGKTGTTVDYGSAREGERKKYNASFAGYFPAENPKYSIIVVLYDPIGAYYGAQVAGPVFQNIVQRVSGKEDRIIPAENLDKVTYAHTGFKGDFENVLDYIGMDYSKTKSRWIDLNSTDQAMVFEKKKIKKDEVPNLRGLGLRDATYVLDCLGMDAEVEGVGKVYKQSLRPGKKIEEGSIKIYLQ